MSKTTRELFIIASATATRRHETALEEALREAATPTRKQRGCVEFLLIRRKDDPLTIIGIERWKSEADHQVHLQGAHVKTLMERMSNILAEPPKIIAYDVIDG